MDSNPAQLAANTGLARARRLQQRITPDICEVTMRRLILFLGLLLASSVSCVPSRSTTAGSEPLPRVAGEYVLTITPSSICRLPMRNQAFPVVVTSSGTAPGDTIRVTLPGGDPSVSLSLVYQPSAALDLVSGPLAIAGNDSAGRGYVLNDELRFYASGMANGRIATNARGMAEISGGFDGPISLSHPQDDERATIASCAAADHQWSVRAR